MVGDDLAFIVAASMTVTSDLSRRTGPKTFLDPAVALCLQSTTGRGFPEAKRRPALVSPGVLSGADHRGRFRISASQRVRIRALALRRRGGGSRSFPNYIEEIYAARDHFGTFR